MTADVRLTTPDLVVLSLLCEGPRHGYDVNRELELRQVKDWAGISRPQVYYSLRKLADLELVVPVADDESGGPDRISYRTTARGRRSLRHALQRQDWTDQRPPPPFFTWLSLSWLLDRDSRRRQVERRRAFLRSEIEREREVLAGAGRDPAPGARVAELMIKLLISQFEAELSWLDDVAAELDRLPVG